MQPVKRTVGLEARPGEEAELSGLLEKPKMEGTTHQKWI